MGLHAVQQSGVRVTIRNESKKTFAFARHPWNVAACMTVKLLPTDVKDNRQARYIDKNRKTEQHILQSKAEKKIISKHDNLEFAASAETTTHHHTHDYQK